MQHIDKKKSHIAKKIVALALTSLLLLTATPINSVAQQENDIKLATTIKADSTTDKLLPIIIGEELSRRGEYEKHFICDDGSFYAVPYPEPVHMRDDEGDWIDIDFPFVVENGRIISQDEDTTITLAETTGFFQPDGLVAFFVDSYSLRWTVEISFKDNVSHMLGQPEDIVVQGGNARQDEQVNAKSETAGIIEASITTSSGLTGFDESRHATETDSLISHKNAVIEKIDSSILSISEEKQLVENINKVIESHNLDIIRSASFERAMVEYPDVFYNGISLRYTLFPGRIKEEVVLKEYGEFESYSVLIDMTGLTAKLLEDNSIHIQDNTGETMAAISPPYMYDNAGASSSKYDVTVSQDDNACVITYTPDAAWLGASERVWPVVLDPTVYTNTKTISNAYQIDNYVYNGQGTTVMPNNGAYLYVGNRVPTGGSVRKEHWSYWRIDKDRLPNIPGGANKITEVFFYIRFPDGTSSNGAIELHKVLSSNWVSNLIVWDNRPKSGALLATRAANTIPNSIPKRIGFSNANVTTAVKSWYSSPSANYGFRLNYVSTTVNDYNGFFSADNGVDYIPYLQIAYTSP